MRSPGHQSLSSQDLLYLWECQRQHPLDWALTVLALHSDVSRDELAKLSIARRDALLVQVREATFGSRFDVFAECPACQQPLELSVNPADIFISEEVSSKDTLMLDGYSLDMRLPNSYDLAALLEAPDINTAQNLLLERCVQIEQQGQHLQVGELPNETLEKLETHLARLDPHAEVLLNLTCPTCSHVWQVLFDIVSFLWREVAHESKRLLGEVHILASAYGWREADILGLSRERRQAYLAMVS
jgi:T4 bacteriophage base plate protein